MSLLLLVAAFLPVQRLYAVPLRVVTKHQFQNVPLAYPHPLHERIYQSSALTCYPRRHTRRFRHAPSLSQSFLLRRVNLRPAVAGVQETPYHRGMRWHEVAHCGTIQGQLLGIGIEFVAGLFAAIGLSSNGQRPTPGERQRPLSGGCFLRCAQ